MNYEGVLKFKGTWRASGKRSYVTAARAKIICRRI